jgi:NADPH:quinone reductase-like Zn-dependent oxidoreductase
MRAAVVSRYGPPEGVEVTEIEKPTPKDNELLVKIHATTVTHGDAMLRRMGRVSRIFMGLFMGGLGKGKVLGHEFAGVVEAIGKDITSFKLGDEVYASTGMTGGAHAEYICIQETVMAAIKPSNLSFEEAAAIPVGAHTAYDILRRADIREGQKVLINGASGSVGSYAVQLARYWGAEVTGVSSATNHEWLKELGTQKMIDYTKHDITEITEKYDVIFDTVRKLSSSKVKGLLKEKGVFLSTSTSIKEKAENLELLTGLIEDGKLKPVIDCKYPLEEIIEAHRYVDDGHKKGNVIITVEKIYKPNSKGW